MKQFLLISLVVMISALTAIHAQNTSPDPQAPAQLAARQTASLNTMLNLNQDQQQKVLCSYQEFYETRSRLMEQHQKSGGSSDGARLQLHHKREACTQQVFAVLSAEQAKRYQQHLDGMKPRF